MKVRRTKAVVAALLAGLLCAGCADITAEDDVSTESAAVSESSAEAVFEEVSLPVFETESSSAPAEESKREEKDQRVIIQVPELCQFPNLPTGCEATAAAMLLNYMGEAVTPETFAAEWLACDKDFYTYGNKQYGPDPNKVFAGDPFTQYAYGCYAGPIADAVNGNSTLCAAEVIRGQPLQSLLENYIDKGVPLLIWATMGMKESTVGKSWYFKDGTPFTWIGGEHCLVLVGYDEEYYYLNDPQSGSTVGYKRHIVEKRYEELGMQAVRFYKRNTD